MASDAKGGQQARRAAMLCQNPRFCLYLDHRRRLKLRLSPEQLPDGTHTAEDAADFIRQACGVTTRALLDAEHHQEAREMLNRIVSDYQRWERQQRRAGL